MLFRLQCGVVNGYYWSPSPESFTSTMTCVQLTTGKVVAGNLTGLNDWIRPSQVPTLPCQVGGNRKVVRVGSEQNSL